MERVKTKISRSDRAAATRRRILDAAYELFVKNGVSATTMGDVAERAKVAVQTVHFVFHTKAELLAAVTDDVSARTIVPGLVEDLARDGDARSIIERLVSLSRRLFPKISRIALAVEASAQGDTVAAARWEAAKAQRYLHVLRFIDVLADTGSLRADLTRERAADIYYGLNSAALYRELIDGRGWTEDQWAEWLTTTLCSQLLI